ncbi:zinc ribbon domain-containing protein [Clostridium felsineum]|uniref:Membrane-associated protein TcaA n=1 Tax=Clostridium felsineum TaxID=36839 RepID=A0A1S8LEW4_9CLOT|nr:zinc-ribbon domain-containing protein [Clostridium felsineum]URZ05840.1 hypothetical protein CLROS_011710 [Clostridium felsineum]URZ10877.1 hypothetical protein CROST_015920 [Clostridium felsineum]
MKFCIKCGNKLEEGQNVCTKCGTKIQNSLSQNRGMDSGTMSKGVLGGKGKIAAIACAAIIVLVGIFIYVGKGQTNPKKVVADFEAAVDQNDKAKVKELLVASNKDLKIDDENVDILIKHLKTASDRDNLYKNLDYQASRLSEDSKADLQKYNIINLTTEKKSLFFTDYKILVNPSYITINSKLKGSDIYVNNKKVGTITSNNFTKKYGPFMPGLYKLKTVYKGKYGSINKVYSIDTTLYTKTIKLAGKMQNLEVTSEEEDAEIFVDNKDTGKKVKDMATIGPIAENTKIYLTMEKDGKKYKSEVRTVGYDYDSSNDKKDEDKPEKFFLDFRSYDGVQSTNEGAVKDLVRNYVSSRSDAANTNNLDAVEKFLYPDSKISKEVKEYVKNAQSKGLKITNKSCDISAWKFCGDGKYGRISTYEVYSIVDKNGEETTKGFYCGYSFKFNDQTNSFQLNRLLESN